MKIWQVNYQDQKGGAAQVANNLHQHYRQRRLDAHMAVVQKGSGDPSIIKITHDEFRPGYAQSLINIACKLETASVRGLGRISRGLRFFADFPRGVELLLGREDFYAPATWHFFGLEDHHVDILHLHNLHKNWVGDRSEYFDLRALPYLSRKIPVVLTLHDAWLLSGHCAHPLNCMRWQLGCGNCPDLSLPPEIKNDSTAFNWKRKRDIYRQCQLHIATPSQWLMDKVKNSILTSGILSARVIPNGVDLTIFHPGEKQREFLKLPGDAKVLLFSADGIKKNPYKDFDLLMQAIEQVARSVPGIIFIALGEKGPNQRTGDAEIRFVPYQNDPELVANYYRAADIYIHAARAENFPTSIIEALACGTPVVATSIGGIPEQISDGRTGFLTKIGEPNEMASRIEQLLSNKTLMCTMKKAAAQDAREKFDVNKQVNAYLDWYQEILDDKNSLLTKIK